MQFFPSAPRLGACQNNCQTIKCLTNEKCNARKKPVRPDRGRHPQRDCRWTAPGGRPSALRGRTVRPARRVPRLPVREALKRLAAQSLIRTERGAFGGAFNQPPVLRTRRPRAAVTTSTLLLGANAISFQVAGEAALRAGTQLHRAGRRTAHRCAAGRDARRDQHPAMRPDLSDEAFCASDVAFHRALVDCAGNEVLSYHLAGSVEGDAAPG